MKKIFLGGLRFVTLYSQQSGSLHQCCNASFEFSFLKYFQCLLLEYTVFFFNLNRRKLTAVPQILQ